MSSTPPPMPPRKPLHFFALNGPNWYNKEEISTNLTSDPGVEKPEKLKEETSEGKSVAGRINEDKELEAPATADGLETLGEAALMALNLEGERRIPGGVEETADIGVFKVQTGQFVLGKSGGDVGEKNKHGQRKPRVVLSRKKVGASKESTTEPKMAAVGTSPSGGEDKALQSPSGEGEYSGGVQGNSWNLRPRNPAKSLKDGNSGSGFGSRGGFPGEKSQSERGKQPKVAGGNKVESLRRKKEKEKETEKEDGNEFTCGVDSVEKRKKAKERERKKEEDKEFKRLMDMMPRFSISLTPAEIEHDLRLMTKKSPKKPRRKSKNVQKSIDRVSPGLWLDKIDPKSYRVKS